MKITPPCLHTVVSSRMCGSNKSQPLFLSFFLQLEHTSSPMIWQKHCETALRYTRATCDIRVFQAQTRNQGCLLILILCSKICPVIQIPCFFLSVCTTAVLMQWTYNWEMVIFHYVAPSSFDCVALLSQSAVWSHLFVRLKVVTWTRHHNICDVSCSEQRIVVCILRNEIKVVGFCGIFGILHVFLAYYSMIVHNHNLSQYIVCQMQSVKNIYNIPSYFTAFRPIIMIWKFPTYKIVCWGSLRTKPWYTAASTWKCCKFCSRCVLLHICKSTIWTR